MVCDILCRMTFVIVCHKMTFMTVVILHKVIIANFDFMIKILLENRKYIREITFQLY